MGLVELMKRYEIDYEKNWDDLHMRNDHGRQIHVMSSMRSCKKST